MQTDSEWLGNVQRAVHEIRTMYDRGRQDAESRPRVNLSLLAYRLGLAETAALYPILRKLEQGGYLLQLDDDYVTFSGKLMGQSRV